MRLAWHTAIRPITAVRTVIFVAVLAATSLVPMLANPTTANAVTDCSPNGIALAGSSWLGGGGVNVCNHPGDGSANYINNVNGVSTLTGYKWQCVEMVNRLYLTEGWTTANWYGNGGGAQGLIHYVPAGLTGQLNGSISYINPGDVITLNNNGDGHAAIINNSSGTTYNIINQNAQQLNSSASITAGSLASGNASLSMAPGTWTGYSVESVIHHPDGNGGGSFTGVGSATFFGGSQMNSGQALGSNAYILSSNGMFALVMQSDGNLVLYSGQSANPVLWQSNTGGHPGAWLNVQTDGNIVVYTASNVPLWSTHTGSQALSQLRLQEDGNLVAYSTSGTALWASGTGGHPAYSYYGGGVLGPNQSLNSGYYLRSSDNRYFLLLQPDSNLVLYGPGYHALWSTGTVNQSVAYAIMQSDGNFVLYRSNGSAVWSTVTPGNGASNAIVQTDGNFVIYTTGGTPTWSSHTSGQI